MFRCILKYSTVHRYITCFNEITHLKHNFVMKINEQTPTKTKQYSKLREGEEGTKVKEGLKGVIALEWVKHCLGSQSHYKAIESTSTTVCHNIDAEIRS